MIFLQKTFTKIFSDTVEQIMRVVCARRGALIFPLSFLSFILGQPPETLPFLPEPKKMHNIILLFEDH